MFEEIAFRHEVSFAMTGHIDENRERNVAKINHNKFKSLSKSK